MTIICPLCNDAVEKLLYRYHIDSERQVIEKIRQANPHWSEEDGICSRCVDYYHTELVLQRRMLPEIGPHFPVRSADDFIILPTGLRLNADPRFTGKGITICFIDSDFYPHSDLTAIKNRVMAIVDIPNDRMIADEHVVLSWHGTMTTVVCAGDGYLSNGLYKGIACDAELVLLKVEDNARQIRDENIVKALEWILQHHDRYHIRIVNISVSGEEMTSYRRSQIDTLAEQLIALGIVVVAAVGNDTAGMIKAPANSPNVIAVGGIDDGNRLGEAEQKLYHSTFGKTVDGIMKPELVAHAAWIAAPILPGTKEQKEAAELYEQLHATDNEHRQAILRRIQSCKYISPHYMHVDGTSFAAPIVTAVIAQLLEIDPALTPAMVRSLVLSTARRIHSAPAERQGFGMIQPRKAVIRSLGAPVSVPPESSPLINTKQRTIGFRIQHEYATQISLAGSFNQWANDELFLEPCRDGIWTIEIPLLPPGRYEYKFFVDDTSWIEDIYNLYREPDGFAGFNSVLIIPELS
ncbi:MAG TPA: S8 family serine peptidase [Chitinophagaceae bacterium]|nr:S8 family serine peptidase [Chitinophagaceae bacterium]